MGVLMCQAAYAGKLDDIRRLVTNGDEICGCPCDEFLGEVVTNFWQESTPMNRTMMGVRQCT
jgi:hypothetical protein